MLSHGAINVADGLASAEVAMACPSDCASTDFRRGERAVCSIVAVTASSLLSLDTAGLASLEAGGSTPLDVLLGADANHKGWDIDSLFADGDVPSVNEDTGVVDRVGKVALLDESLQSALQELGRSQTEHIIELALVVLQETESHHSADEGLTY